MDDPFVTPITKSYVPAVDGVPESDVVEAVEDASSERPKGNVPDAMRHENIPEAVVDAEITAEYAAPTVPSGNEDMGAIAIGGGGTT